MPIFLFNTSRTLWLTLLVVVSVFGSNSAIYAQEIVWQQTNGPYGGTVQCFAKAANIIFAGTKTGGIYRSVDSGKSWTAANIGIPLRSNAYYPSITSFAVMGKKVFVALGYGGIYQTEDYGNSWQQCTEELTGINVTSLVVAPDSSTLIIGTENNGIFRSVDKGEHWTTKGFNQQRILALTVCDTVLIASSYETGVYRSTDNGAAWEYRRIDSKQGSGIIGSFAVLGKEVYAGAWYSNELYYSVDYGINWNTIKGNAALKAGSIQALSFRDSLLYAATQLKGVIVSSDSGKTWRQAQTTENNGTNTLALYSEGTTVLAGTEGYGVLRSTDEGANWQVSNQGMDNAEITSMASIGTTLFAAIRGAGVVRSGDKGVTWQNINKGLAYPTLFDLCAKGNTLFALSTIKQQNNVYRSTDMGDTWEARGSTGQGNCYTLAATPTTLFAGAVDGIFSAYGGVYRSADDGLTWAQYDNTFFHTSITNISVSGNDVYVAASGNGGINGGVYHSKDEGIHWEQIESLLTIGSLSDICAVDSTIIATGDSYGAVYISNDKGFFWKKEENTLKDFFVNKGVFGVSANLFFLPIFAEVFATRDKGTTWFSASKGMENLGVRNFAATEGTVFAGTTRKGVFRTAGNISAIAEKDSPQALNIECTPNPVSNGHLEIRWVSDAPSFTTLSIVDMLGREIALLNDSALEAGEHRRSWNTMHQARGVYYCVLRTAGIEKVLKVIVP